MQITRFVLPIMICLLLLCVVLAGVARLVGYGLPRSGELAYSYLRHVDDWDISLMDIERGVHVPIVASPFMDGWPTWSPDGERMVFGYEPLTIYGNESGNPNALAFSQTLNINGFYPSWSHDGNHIAFTDLDEYAVYQVYITGVDGSKVRQLTVNGGWHPSWSPDNGQIVFSCPLHNTSQICVVSVHEGNIENLTQGRVEGNFPSWSPDGQQILFTCTSALSASISFSYLCVMDANGDNFRIMNYEHDRVSRPTWSPDGRQIAFADAGDLYIMNVDGGNLRALTSGDGEYDSPSWRP